MSWQLSTSTYITTRADNVEKEDNIKNVISSFKEKVEQFRTFFSKMPKALSEQPFPGSPTGSVFSFYLNFASVYAISVKNSGLTIWDPLYSWVSENRQKTKNEGGGNPNG